MFSTLVFALNTVLLSSQVAALAIEKRTTYPFKRIVAFGDEFSDNGNGSFAHGITGDPSFVYGYNTWTNGPVAVSYFAGGMGIPMSDFAFGGCCGGESFGATLDEAYTESPAGSPSLVTQIKNYTSKRATTTVKTSLHFIWVGQNDLSKHTDVFWEGDPANADFANEISTRLTASVKTLLNHGAPYILVANLYPKHLAPVTTTYLCGDSASCVTAWGNIISSANAAIKSALAPFGKKVIYYDVYSFMVELMNNKDAHGFTQPLSYYCDGDENAKWDDCMTKGHAAEYFWMNFQQPTARVHALIAGDMKRVVDGHFA
ncbi:hypothetical protein K402DRAFT_326660 [Aulographum hederae CBS 113979]|uniref:Carbohydrate esterase family 16 protein n=1 Tax=Aulographum hederae CBS 113979 TaxID=1176131 RepID=A0A6G1H8Z4_9PEZI|nr:hypothetical protein K402DRAFT_326660 [Aulographum hederae CBS 113979]